MTFRNGLNKQEIAFKQGIEAVEQKMERQLLMASGEIPFESDEVVVVTAQQRFLELQDQSRQLSEQLRNTKQYYSNNRKSTLKELHYPQFESQARILQSEVQKSQKNIDISQRSAANMVKYMSKKDRQELGNSQRPVSPIHKIEQKAKVSSKEIGLMDVMAQRMNEVMGIPDKSFTRVLPP